jgi:hypothetical protein
MCNGENEQEFGVDCVDQSEGKTPEHEMAQFALDSCALHGVGCALQRTVVLYLIEH